MDALKILETTLRDGSYVIDFQFTANDTAVICRALEEVGFGLIELGHGVGLGASRANMGKAAETDETYLKVAADTLNTADWGMFCIPGIAALSDIDLAAEYGMDFIRIGTDVAKVEESISYIERARHHGMLVTANFMKSYTMEPRQFAQQAMLSQSYGSQVIYIVDSAGGMLTSDLEGYFSAIRDLTDIPIGFHGHNNLELAIPNSLRAAELGASIVDTSLQGLGRSAGNAVTEIFLLVLERVGVSMGIEPLLVMDIGEKYIKPLVQKQGYSSVDMVSGYAQFHSSYMTIIREFSSKYRIDPRRLIIAVCEQDKVNAPPDLVERAAEKISLETDEVFTARFRLDQYHGDEQR